MATLLFVDCRFSCKILISFHSVLKTHTHTKQIFGRTFKKMISYSLVCSSATRTLTEHLSCIFKDISRSFLSSLLLDLIFSHGRTNGCTKPKKKTKFKALTLLSFSSKTALHFSAVLLSRKQVFSSKKLKVYYFRTKTLIQTFIKDIMANLWYV